MGLSSYAMLVYLQGAYNSEPNSNPNKHVPGRQQTREISREIVKITVSLIVIGKSEVNVFCTIKGSTKAFCETLLYNIWRLMAIKRF